MLLHLLLEIILITMVLGSFQDQEPNERATKLHQTRFKKDIGLKKEDFPQKDAHLLKNIIPNSYHLKLQPFPEEGYFQGRVHINVTCLEPTDKIVLHAHEDLQVDRESLSIKRLLKKNPKSENMTQNVRRRNPELSISRVRRNFTTQQYRIILRRELKKGAMYQVTLAFTSNLSNESNCAFCFSSYEDQNTQNSSWFVTTHMKLGNARRVFPCFDEPKFKALFTLSIAHPQNLKATSNMDVKASEVMADLDGWMWDHFNETPPMSTISLFVIIFNPLSFHEISSVSSSGNFTISGYAQPHLLSFLQDEMEQVTHIMDFLEQYLNRSYPLPHLNLIALPQISSMAAESYWGNILFDEAELSVQDLPWQLLYALSSQWIGHLVTPHQWSSVYPSHALDEYLSLISSQDAYDSAMGWKPDDCYTLYNEFSKVNVSAQSKKLQAMKYTWVVNMLSHALTADTFQQGIRNFVEKWKYKTFRECHLWNTLSKRAWDDHSLGTSVSVSNIVSSWVKPDRYPVVTVSRNYDNNSAIVKQEVFIRRWPYKVSGQDNMLWWVPIMYLTQENMDVQNMSTITWMKKEREITIENLPEPDSFVIINPEDIGMFIVNYDSNNWDMLVKYLIISGEGDGSPLIPTATRAKLLHNAWYLALGGRLDFATALNITLFLRTETEVPVWKALSQIYFTVSWKLVGTKAETKFDRFIGEMLVPMYNSTENSTFEDNHPKAEISALAHYILCKAGHKEAVTRARLEFEEWLKEPKEIDGGNMWAAFRWVEEDWEIGLKRVIDLLHNESNSDLRKFLLSQLMSSAVQPNKTERLLEMLLIDESYTFTTAELKESLAATVDSQTFLTFIINNWESIKRRFEKKINIWHYILEQATKKWKTQQGYDMVAEFYKTHKDKLGEAVHVVKHSLQIIKTNKEGTYRNLPALETWLDHYLPAEENGSLFYSI